MAYGTVNTDIVADSSGGRLAPISSVFRNRIINGAMVIDQRNAGASVTPTVSTWAYNLDRWALFTTQANKLTVQQVSDAPTGFANSLKITSSAATTLGTGDIFSLRQIIEGYNFADFMYGTASANTLTLSFWVKSSLTGTFGGALQNNGGTRGYAFTYTISSANTWEYKTVTVAGDTAGTWVGATNGIGIAVVWGLGVGADYSKTAGSWGNSTYTNSATGATSVVGTNGATFYITGVQLEVGSSATGFEYRQYGQELALCQRYYFRNTLAPYNNSGSGLNDSSTSALIVMPFPTTMRTAPTALEQSGVAADYSIRITGATYVVCSAVPTFNSATTYNAATNFTTSSGLTGGQSISLRPTNSTYLGWSAEL